MCIYRMLIGKFVWEDIVVGYMIVLMNVDVWFLNKLLIFWVKLVVFMFWLEIDLLL